MTERNVAFLDIGTNSIRLLLVRVNDSFTILSEQKETVRLGEAQFNDGYLQPEAMQRAVLVCKSFADMARANHCEEIIAVATSATREARNQRPFLRLLKRDAGLDVHPISGLEEARLTYLGVSSGVHLEDKEAIIIDIGGGSTEISIGNQEEYRHLDSMKLGAIRLTTQFFGENYSTAVSDVQYERLQQHVRNVAVRSIQKAQRYNYELAFGSSGTIENLGDITMQHFEGRARGPGDVLSYVQLREMMQHLRALPLKQRAHVPGISARRGDLIVAGGAILHTLMQELGIDQIGISERALREGLLTDYLRRHDTSGLAHETSVRRRSVWELARRTNIDEEHARKVQQLTLALFDSGRTIGLHTVPDAYRELLGYAAILHDVGIFISYSNHQDHSYYLIRNADLLGMDQNEISIIAATSFFHRARLPQKRYKKFAGLEDGEREAVKVMAILLRIAEALDRGHKGVAGDASFVEGKKGSIVLEIACAGDCQLELWGLQNHLKAFKWAFKRRLEVREREVEGKNAAGSVNQAKT